MKEQSQLLVGLLQSVEKALEATKVFEHFIDSENSQNFQKSDHFPRLSNNLYILQSLKEKRNKEWNQTNKVDSIHQLEEELQLKM